MTIPTGTVSLDTVAEHFARTAADVDAATADIRDGLRWLAASGLVAESAQALPVAVALVERVARECLSSAFSLWAHLMVLEYLRQADDTAGHDHVRSALCAGTAIGATAMAPALRDVAGLEPVPVAAQAGPDGTLRLNGPIQWASNLFDDAVLVVPVRLGPGGRRAVVRVRRDAPGVEAGRQPALLALNATASSSLRLDDVRIDPEAVLTWDLAGFVVRIRPAFLLIQSAFCAGLAHRSAGAAGAHLTGPNTELTDRVTATASRVTEVRRRLRVAAAGPDSLSKAGLLRLRLDAAEVAADATRLESTVRGGAGYLASSEVSRRLREGAFLPIQSPTEGQLRWELSRCA
jgi:alkylation response protein AidB-like acyl-CoA dehydrogenase